MPSNPGAKRAAFSVLGSLNPKTQDHKEGQIKTLGDLVEATIYLDPNR